jgi:hypothetical protein
VQCELQFFIIIIITTTTTSIFIIWSQNPNTAVLWKMQQTVLYQHKHVGNGPAGRPDRKSGKQCPWIQQV